MATWPHESSPLRTTAAVEIDQIATGLPRLRILRPRPGKVEQADGHQFRPDVQGLRALAVGLVVLYHQYPSEVPGGYIGVDVFFVISGYLITDHLLRGFRRSGRIRMLDFYGRRARRLLPAAAVVLAATWLVSTVALPATRLPADAIQIKASALYYQNWVLAHDAVDYLTANDAPSPFSTFGRCRLKSDSTWCVLGFSSWQPY